LFGAEGKNLSDISSQVASESSSYPSVNLALPLTVITGSATTNTESSTTDSNSDLQIHLISPSALLGLTSVSQISKHQIPSLGAKYSYQPKVWLAQYQLDICRDLDVEFSCQVEYHQLHNYKFNKFRLG
jgi:hypothetical protein